MNVHAQVPAYADDENATLLKDMLFGVLNKLPFNVDWASTDAALWEQGFAEAFTPNSDFNIDPLAIVALVSRSIGLSGRLATWTTTSAPLLMVLGSSSFPKSAELYCRIVNNAASVAVAIHGIDSVPNRLGSQLIVSISHQGKLTLTGQSQLIAFGLQASVILVSARYQDELVILELPSSFLSHHMRPCKSMDYLPFAKLDVCDLEIDASYIILSGEDAQKFLSSLYNSIYVATLAETIGALEATLQYTRQHLLTRVQFARPLAHNQALRHRYVDMEIMLAKAVSMLPLAIISAHLDEEPDLLNAAYIISKAARHISQESIQMHGAIGMAAETPVARYFNRIMRLTHWFGDEESTLSRLVCSYNKSEAYTC